MTDPKEAWTSGDGSVLPEGTVAWVLVDGAVLEAPLLWAGGRWLAHDVEGQAFDGPNPVTAYMVLHPPEPPGAAKHTPALRPPINVVPLAGRLAQNGWCRKCGWDSKDPRCPTQHPTSCDGVI